ncbi:class I SAM-dependent methyltransferase [Nocardioides anomalus]|uniref:Class I SAM-dependent methyltransferase n=1 Tax=Nocardioides anomalus TaxID=2712223 RepID=A0A6G6WI58_9ACTN|nr:class I SAM-dependent methyltransferase [Nocardioides anomalus]QIG44902.1 class I SAM-dependent methyltransferase [Nocardioides anomalus]
MSTDETSQSREPARSFGGVADAYHRGRPTYPREAVVWLTGEQPLRVLELGAGTGKLTEQLVALGHDVHATEPDAQMLALLQKNLPDVRVSQSTAEEIPAGDGSYDVVVSAQAFHWFDPARALPEIARVLRPHGRVSLVWNQRDERIPWVKRLGKIIGTQERLTEPAELLTRSKLFGETEEAAYRFWQVVDRGTVQDLVRSRSNIAVLSEGQQEAKMAEVLAFYDEYGRGMDGMQLPYTASCFRAEVLDRVVPTLPLKSEEPAEGGEDGQVSDGSSTDMLLIDFR